ncbi:PP2C family protein-serine/threonine phosphatase [Cyanobium sp. Morenito 9A2]|uniref:PP2C family protein-serine/threonine phosphatase n=1 Tax=Cyanobium sp. Morenito 9A2 TaxID=2823718 RepID=UPI0020CE69F3|nr:SpoIIE family protein phosphatase [Cyanobium sp. Morenito 9A2]MCP9849415.1 SpoIIE family protein phosphatase [Cyanobium sp. Morenito 9A2]
MSGPMRLLLIDDDRILQLVLQRVLKREGAEVLLASDGRTGLAMAREHAPHLVLCDWNMEGMDGLEVCRHFKADPQLSAIFFILLTSRSEVKDQVMGLDAGADDFLTKPVEAAELTARVRAGMRLYESNQSLRELSLDLERQKRQLEEEMSRAADYVSSILPSSLKGPISIESLFLPSQRLGGDCYDFYWLDQDHFVVYMLDVSGHGLAAALPSISIHNLLRSNAIDSSIRCHPAQVLENLNAFFQMGQQNEQYFTIWYGVYRPTTRNLTYASAGHPPCFLLPGQAETGESIQQLKTNGMPIGLFEEVTYLEQVQSILPGSLIYLYTDGIYECLPSDNQRVTWDLDQFKNHLLATSLPEPPALPALLAEIRQLSGSPTFNDDVSLMQIRFSHLQPDQD